ncbi:MAG: tRNA 2-thiouridine(34) synthase MnmA [Clostridia bacterium]
MANKKVLLGMSGGVDSSTSAILLKEAGYEVIGATMKLWEDKECPEVEGGCCSFSATYDAKRVCDKLEIPHYTLNCEEDFQKYVIDNFVSCYQCCQTPNPCVECNKYLKFGTFYQKALELGCDYIATGHYAKVEYSEKYQSYVLKKSESDKKDQTYFLYSIPKEVLPKMLFPLEGFKTKEEVRKIAEKYELKVAHKKDSQEVCFIPDNDYGKFLTQKAKINSKKGNIVLQDGTILGQHKGLIFYTVGQRKGLGIAYKEPLYVLKLNNETNEVIVGTEKELYTKNLYANDLNFLLDIDLSKPIEVMAKIRYRSEPAKAMLEIVENDKNEKIAKLEFKEAQRAITPGQSVVFYLEDIVLGGGKIFGDS